MDGKAKARRPAKPSPAPSDPVSIALDPAMTYSAANRLLDALAGVTSVPEVVIDASKVERMSTAAVLAVLAFAKARPEITPPAIIRNPSGAFVDAFSELGMFQPLMSMEFRT